MTPYTLQSYLPLYLGQKVKTFALGDINSFGMFTGIELDARPDHAFITVTFSDNQYRIFRAFEVKLILRPLSSMTEEEERELGKIALPECDAPRSRFVLSMESTGKNSEGTLMMDNYTPEMVVWLLSKGFDIFGLKEKGLCLYPEEL